MKGLGWRLFCLIAFPLTLGLAEENLISNDLKSGNHSIKINKEEGSRSGAVSESEESKETVTKSESNEPTTDDAEQATDNDATHLSDTKRSWEENINNNYKPGYFAPQIYNKINKLPPAYLGLAQDNKFNKVLFHGKSYPPGYLVTEGKHDQNEYEYLPNPNVNIQNANQIVTNDGYPGSDANQILISGSNNNGMNQRTAVGEEEKGDESKSDAYSRLVPLSERILLHNIPGATNLLTCSREGELHNFWSSAYQCLVCACIKDDGFLRPVCASCAGCMAPNPRIVKVPEIVEVPEVDIPGIPTPVRPTIPDILEMTTESTIEDDVTCNPLPSGQPFDNPLHPCQICICIETINLYGKPDVHITCQENSQCVLPTDVAVIPPIPDVPVPSPYCDKFPLNVLFPHPSDACKTCRCSVQLSQLGVSERLITCSLNPDCSLTPEPESITEISPYYPVSVEPQVVPIEPQVIPVSPEPVPIFGIETTESSWTPVTVAPPAPLVHGPLPGPSPHDSCRPYVANQPFQHPWDECQICVCTEAFLKKHINIEVNCYTKKSCCIEPPFDMVTATLPPIPHMQTGKIQIQDAICEYRTFGVEFTHPNDPCKICTCELQGRLITSLCKRSSNPECKLLPVYPTATATYEDLAQSHSYLPPGPQFLPGTQPSPNSISSYNTASSSQNKAIKNAFVSYQNPYGASGLHSMGSSQSSADQQALSYNQWNLQNHRDDQRYKYQNIQGSTGAQRPGAKGYGLQKLKSPGSQYGYGEGYYGGGNGLQDFGYPQSGQGSYQTQTGVYPQNYPGYLNYGQGYPGYHASLRPKAVISQAKASAAASATSSGLQNSFAYSPGYQLSGSGVGFPPKSKAIYSQSSASAQSSAQASSTSAIKYGGRSGKPDDNESSEKKN